MSMNIDIVCVGKIKEKYLKDAIDEYSKRLSRYCKLSIIEVGDEKTPDGQSALLDEKVKIIEGERILKAIKSNAFVILCELNGKMPSSVELSEYIDNLGIKGIADIVFIIGGSLGVSEAVKNRADYKLCFSKMTFPHQLMRVILLEQVYRAYRIMNNEPYHK